MESHDYIPFDENKVGKRLSLSGEHSVYQYGDKQVIKFPIGPIYRANSEEAYLKVANEAKLAETYLAEFMVPFEVLTYIKKGRKKYCIIQNFVKGEALKIKFMQDPELRSRLQKLIDANNIMYSSSGFTVELFGIRRLIVHGLIPEMQNVLILPDRSLKIIDFGMISDTMMVSSSPLVRMVIQWAVKRQKKLLALYLGKTDRN